jgi:Xaa-Pro dipeptidase
MDWPMVYHGNPVVAEPNMVFFLHMILMDSETETAMCFGHTVQVTETGCEALSRMDLDLVVK